MKIFACEVYCNDSSVRLCAQLFHVPYFNAWALPCLALYECVQRCCTELFHTFSLDCLNGSINHTTRRLAHTTVQGIVYSRSRVRKFVNVTTILIHQRCSVFLPGQAVCFRQRKGRWRNTAGRPIPVLRLLCRLGRNGGAQCGLRVSHQTGTGWSVRITAGRWNLEWHDWRANQTCKSLPHSIFLLAY